MVLTILILILIFGVGGIGYRGGYGATYYGGGLGGIILLILLLWALGVIR